VDEKLTNFSSVSPSVVAIGACSANFALHLSLGRYILQIGRLDETKFTKLPRERLKGQQRKAVSTSCLRRNYISRAQADVVLSRLAWQCMPCQVGPDMHESSRHRSGEEIIFEVITTWITLRVWYHIGCWFKRQKSTDTTCASAHFLLLPCLGAAGMPYKTILGCGNWKNVF